MKSVSCAEGGCIGKKALVKVICVLKMMMILTERVGEITLLALEVGVSPQRVVLMVKVTWLQLTKHTDVSFLG